MSYKKNLEQLESYFEKKGQAFHYDIHKKCQERPE